MGEKHQEKDEALELRSQALELLHARERGGDGGERSDQLSEFAARSADHARAVRAAEHFVALTEQLDGDRIRAFAKNAGRLQLWAARASDHSGLMATATLAVVALVAIGFMVPRDESRSSVPPSVPVAGTAETFVAPLRANREIILRDGSRVWLAWDTRIEASFENGERRIRLTRGTAAFEVVPDETRPFIVSSLGVRTEVTGTEFVVNMRASEGVEVAVIEGEVRVAAGKDLDDAAALTAASAIRVTDGVLGAVEHRSRSEIGRWRDGMLVFENRSLLDALRVIEPYSSYRIDATNIAGHRGRVSGVFFTDRADDALFTLLETHRVSAEAGAEHTLRLY